MNLWGQLNYTLIVKLWGQLHIHCKKVVGTITLIVKKCGDNNTLLIKLHTHGNNCEDNNILIVNILGTITHSWYNCGDNNTLDKFVGTITHSW